MALPLRHSMRGRMFRLHTRESMMHEHRSRSLCLRGVRAAVRRRHSEVVVGRIQHVLGRSPTTCGSSNRSNWLSNHVQDVFLANVK